LTGDLTYEILAPHICLNILVHQILQRLQP